jgi:hypothetical protein
VVNTFGDTALLSIVEQHASSLQHLTLAGCKGITWSGVEGLKVKGVPYSVLSREFVGVAS